MTKSKKISMLLFSLLLVFASFLFVACGSKNYSDTLLTCSENTIELYVGEQKNVTFTINNPVADMDKKLEYTINNTNISVQEIASQDYSTTYTITGERGGKSTLSVTTVEGGKNSSITIIVRQFTDKLEAGSNSLYVSKLSEFVPTGSDFKFNDEATERDLQFYFYGITKESGSLILDDVKREEEFINEFVSVQLYTYHDADYLIFKDKAGEFYTLNTGMSIAGSNNLKFQFLNVERTEEGFNFSVDNATSVVAGDKFTFIAKYSSEEESDLYVERDFYVLVDIEKDSVEHDYGYKVEGMNFVPGSDSSYKIEDINTDSIILIPNYTTTIMEGHLIGEKVNFLTAYIEVSINSANELLLMKSSSENTDIVNSTLLGKNVSDNVTTYYIQINCSTGIKSKTNYNITFYYEGFENSQDSNVNFTYSIPVEVRIIPMKVLVNNIDPNEVDLSYTFYDNYIGDFGWQPLQFSVIPEGAEYGSLEIDLTNTDLKIRYNNQEFENEVVTIDDLKKIVYIKSIEEAKLTAGLQQIDARLNFNIIQDDFIDIRLNYEIVKGVDVLDFDSDKFEEEGIFVDLASSEPVQFKNIYADAIFSSIDFQLLSGVDCVRFEVDKENPYILEGLKYYLNFKIRPIAASNGSTYVINLDNGKQISITIAVRESLSSVQIVSNNEQNIANLISTTEESETTSASSLYYVQHKNDNGYFDINVIANHNENSLAIRSIQTELNSNVIQLGDATDNNKKFNIYTRENGSAKVTLTINGYEIKDFECNQITKEYVINVVSYDYIENLNVFKLQDGQKTYPANTRATYGYVYSNTRIESARTLKLSVSPKNTDAYLFSEPASMTYVADTYRQNYLYWESPDVSTYLNGSEVNIMYYSAVENNIYTIGSYGTFDTSTLTFTAYSNLQNQVSFKLMAHVRQYGKTYTYTVNVKIDIYEEVKEITLQKSISELEFSSLKTEESIIAYATNKDATNGKIVAILQGGQITVDNVVYTMFDEFTDKDYIESDNKYQIKLKINEDFLTHAEGYTGKMEGTLLITAADWLDGGGNIDTKYQDYVLKINVTFANGTVNNRFTINDANDLIAVKNNLSAHYQIKSTVDASMISSALPLGELKGSIIGTSEYSSITGLNIINGSTEVIDDVTYNYYGLFTKIANNAYIEYITFEGSINIGTSTQRLANNNIGFVAGVNNGSLINIGVNLSESNIYVLNGNIGGLVGQNNGQIIQDFTLFEDNSSLTRTYSSEYLLSDEVGRLSYAGMSPKTTVFMNGFLNIVYTADTEKDNNIGGLVGLNNGIIQKVDSQSLTFNGYTNYMAYSLIKATPTDDIARSYIGGLVGQNSSDRVVGRVFAGVNEISPLDQQYEFSIYNIYEHFETEAGETFVQGNFTAGDGIVVGGEVSGYGYIGGVVGYIQNLSDDNVLSGITSRIFVRGRIGGESRTSVPNVAVIANILGKGDSVSIPTAFAIQAVDDGRSGEAASMVVVYANSSDALGNYLINTNYLGFGNFENGIDSLSPYMNTTNDKAYKNVLSYTLSREKQFITTDNLGEISNNIIEEGNKDIYYGDFVIVATNNGDKLVIGQAYFEFGNDIDLSLEARFDNLMRSNTGKNEIYYMYYFKAASGRGDVEVTDAQVQLDAYLNKFSVNSNLYPFIAKGEMNFESETKDTLEIDQNGRITVKKEGLARITASSVLNSNNALSFYIYVVNYFNSESTIDEAERSSIIYPTPTSEGYSDNYDYDESTIELRGNVSKSIYVVPKYDLSLSLANNRNFMSNKTGVVIFNNIAFELASNDNISAIVTEETNSLDISIVGSTITFRRTEKTEEKAYPITISPILKLDMPEQNQIVEYFSYVNKILTKPEVEYKFGAISINHQVEATPIHSSDTFVDYIYIESTENNYLKESPTYYIVNSNNEIVQDSSTVDKLFNIEFIYVSSEQDDLKSIHTYRLEISINRYSAAFKDRYDNNIYGDYRLNIQALTNSGINLDILITFEQNGILSVVVDNYTSLNDATASKGLSNVSEWAYPGESGLLAITLTPEDSDFDYILIENAETNYNQGNSVANFEFLARKDSPTGDANLFDNQDIAASTTARGVKIFLTDIISTYEKEEYQDYNGVIYVKYDMSSQNVVDRSISNVEITLFKDEIKTAYVNKPLTIKLQNFVSVDIDGKHAKKDQQGYYAAYDVARGLRYKLNINSYGFLSENIFLSLSDSTFGEIIKEPNGEYYLQITSNTINYSSSSYFEILVSALQTEGEVTRMASSKTKVNVFEYVVNYNGENTLNADIVTGMGNGAISVQLGTQTTFALDIYDYIEYDSTNNEVVAKIDAFMKDMTEKGSWISYTNLITDEQPDYSSAKNPDDPIFSINGNSQGNKRNTYTLGYVREQAQAKKNYFYSYSGLDLIPSKLHTPSENFYYFVYTGRFKEENGVYTFDSAEGTLRNTITTRFTLNVFTSSSEESPIPIYDYRDFINMQPNGYYILLNDIELPSTMTDDGQEAYRPLSGTFASFDGNGHTINLSGTYDMGALSEIGVFSRLSEGSIIKNLNVNYTAAKDGSDLNTDVTDTTYALSGLRLVRFITTAETFRFGGIVAENAGIITNCKVYTDNVNNSEYYISVKADNALNSTSFIGGIVANNTGFITNSNVSINVKAPFYIAGVVAQNSNKVSGCYFKKGKLINNSQFDQHVAGFVITNSQNGQILSSYVSGESFNNSLYSSDRDNGSYIESTIAAAGFAYQNRGLIKDCYTDINLSRTRYEMAGFVYYNGGEITNSFSLSKLRDNVTASAGFARYDQYENTNGSFSNCYYFYNRISNKPTQSGKDFDEDGFLPVQYDDRNNVTYGGNINTSLVQVYYQGIEALNAEGFANVAENFADYAYQNTIGANAIWFFSTGISSDTFVDYKPTTKKVSISNETDDKVQINTEYDVSNMVFAKNRLELVNPNIAALSVKNFSYSEVDETTNDVIYHYVDDSTSPNRGTLHNPRLIYDAKTMENEILEQSSLTSINTASYRLISDINYNNLIGLSGLYKVTYAGVLEGNGMRISNISMASMERMANAGLFGQIGYSASRTGTVKNLTISPKQVAFTNTNNVGVLAGTLKGGNVYGVTIEDSDSGAITVSGMNFVGGLVGKAISSYTIKDVYCGIDVAASYSPTSDVSYTEGSSAESAYSYAGGAIGFVGTGNIYNVHIAGIDNVMGSRSGFAYGGLGRGANVNYTFVDIPTGAVMRAYHYGGFVAGEVAGNLNYVYVSDNRNIESTFAVVPKVPIAVGGVAGLLNGGTITQAIMNQRFRVTSVNTDAKAIGVVGGIVGLVSTNTNHISYIKQSGVYADIHGSSVLGGAVGQVSSAMVIDQVAVRSSKLTVSGQKANPVLGGIVGGIEDVSNSTLTMTNSYCTANLEVNTNTSGVMSTAFIGGLIGKTSDKRIPVLSYCYTTSKIDATVYDTRALGSPIDFGELLPREGVTLENTVGNASYVYSIYRKPSTTGEKYDNVYYLGYSVGVKTEDISSKESKGGQNDGENGAYTSAARASFVTFKTNVKSVQMRAQINNFGEDSYNLVTGNTTISALYSLFGDKTDIWVVSADSLSMLIFEDNIQWISKI